MSTKASTIRDIVFCTLQRKYDSAFQRELVEKTGLETFLPQKMQHKMWHCIPTLSSDCADVNDAMVKSATIGCSMLLRCEELSRLKEWVSKVEMEDKDVRLTCQPTDKKNELVVAVYVDASADSTASWNIHGLSVLDKLQKNHDFILLKLHELFGKKIAFGVFEFQN